MVKHGLLEWDEAEKVNKKLLKGGGKSSGGGGSSSKSKAKANDDDDFQKSKSKGKGKAPAKKPSPKPSIPQEDSSDVRAQAAFFHSSRRTLSSRTHLTLASRLASQEEFDAKPAAKSKKGNGKAPAPAPKPAAKRKSIEPEPDSSDDEEDTPIAQKKKAKTSAAPAKKTAPAKKKGKEVINRARAGYFYRAVCGVTTYLELIQLPLAQENTKISRAAQCTLYSFLHLARVSLRARATVHRSATTPHIYFLAPTSGSGAYAESSPRLWLAPFSSALSAAELSVALSTDWSAFLSSNRLVRLGAGRATRPL